MSAMPATLRKRLLLVAAVAGGLGLGGMVSAQSLVNAGFETPGISGNQYTPGFGGLSGISGWTFGASGSDSYNGYVHAGDTGLGPLGIPEGSQAAFIQGSGSISQDVVFSAGTYALSFYAEARGGGLGPEPLLVTLGGTPVTFSASSTFVAGSNTSFDLVTSDPFSLSAGTYTLAFTGANPYGFADRTTFIDNVGISAVPEPATCAALVGAAALGLAMWRRRPAT